VIKGSKKMLISLYYSTRDLDLLVSLSILPDAINDLSRESSLSAKCVPKFVIECNFLSRSRCHRSRSVIQRLPSIASRMMIINGFAPRIMIGWFMISIHAIMLFTTAAVISSAPKIVLAVHGNLVLIFYQAMVLSLREEIPNLF
jgi:hypothetical protein